MERAVFTLKKQTPGPNGFPLIFYNDRWNIISVVIIQAVQGSFPGKATLEGINKIFIYPIPKEEEADSLKDFRPISPFEWDVSNYNQAVGH